MATYQAVAEGVYQLSLPLPFALRQVNCYLLWGETGWNIIDTGLNIPEARQVWLDTFAALGIGSGDIERIILTHTHPDHYGLAGWLQAWSGAAVWMSPREEEQVEQVWKQTYAASKGFLGEALLNILSPEVVEGVNAAVHYVRQMTLPHPEAIEIIRYDSELIIGQRTFQAIHAPGHSDGQLVFYDAADKLVFCGDQVLMKISPNIGLWSVSEPDPLRSYLASLQTLQKLDVRLGLPGHRAVITDWSGRLTELEAHHNDRLTAMLAAVNGSGTNLYQICTAVFDVEKLGDHEIRFALAETLAHVEYMVGQNQLTRDETWHYYRI